MLTVITPLYYFKDEPVHLLVVGNTIIELTYDPCHQTQNDSDSDEGPVPRVRSVHRGYAQKDED